MRKYVCFSLGLALPALAVFFTGCLTQTTYETANLLKKNHVDITPGYSGYYLHASGPDAPDVNSNWKNSYGVSLGYGVTDGFNVYGYYEYSDYPQFARFGEEAGLHFFQLEPKFELERARNSVSFPIGYTEYAGIKVLQFGARSFTNFYWSRKSFYCLSVSGMANVGFEDRDDFAGALVVNNVFNAALPQRFYIRPQIGVDVSALLFSAAAGFQLASINVGIGLGREF
ncbi:MAG: hypothetical protein ABI036_05425 [Fibrobacteria bacterium]